MDQVWILFDREYKYSTAPRIVSKTTKKHSNLETLMKNHAFDNITKMSYSKKQDKSYTTNCIFWNNKANFHWIHKWALLGCTNTQSIIEIHNCLVRPIVLNIFVKCQQLSDKSESYRYMVTDYFLRNLPAHPFYDFSNIGLVRLPTEPPQIGCMCIFRESLSATDGVR